jgi:protein-S-isoprenylcysteine O-methyltransferase Ste14
MSVSASTPRLRLTLAWYLLVIVLVTVSERPLAQGLAGSFAGIAGLILMAGAALGRLWTSTFIAGIKDVQLVTTGPYSMCRNPLYALSIVGGIGVGFASRSVVLTFATLALLLVLYLQAIRSEEELLLTRHGEAFRRYCADVPRLLPRLARYAPPSAIEVNVAIYAKAFRDAGSFVLLFVVLEALDALHAANLLPELFPLY